MSRNSWQTFWTFQNSIKTSFPFITHFFCQILLHDRQKNTASFKKSWWRHSSKADDVRKMEIPIMTRIKKTNWTLNKLYYMFIYLSSFHTVFLKCITLWTITKARSKNIVQAAVLPEQRLLPVSWVIPFPTKSTSCRWTLVSNFYH